MSDGLRLQLTGIAKRFGALQVLDDVNLELRGGEVHALLGENGAGKSTLMNVLYGIFQPDQGEIRLDGEVIRPRDPAEARRLGFGMVHQHFTVVTQLTTAENFALSLVEAGFRYKPVEAAESALRLASRFGLDIGDPFALTGTLSVGARQRIEILKALAADARVLILDEPTAVLTPGEVGQLFDVLWALRQEGRLVVFITHKLQEVRSIADRVSVLRRGTIVGGGTPATISDDDILFLQQIGLRSILVNFNPADASLDAMRRVQERFARHNIKIFGGLNYTYRSLKIQLGQPGRDEDIEHYQTFLRNLGRLDIPVATYDFHPANTYTTAIVTHRGYTVREFSVEDFRAKVEKQQFDREYSADEIWANYDTVATLSGLHDDASRHFR